MIKRTPQEIADHYGKRALLEQLLIECAEMGVITSYYLKGDSIDESLAVGIADLEILLEQVKYIMKIDPTKLGEIKKQKIGLRQSVIAKESHEEEEE